MAVALVTMADCTRCFQGEPSQRERDAEIARGRGSAPHAAPPPCAQPPRPFHTPGVSWVVDAPSPWTGGLPSVELAPRRSASPVADVTQRLSALLADRYRIERELGQGGMATVYLARDLKHDRDVALKVLKPELALALGAERFLAEIRVMATLQHPNLLPLFDSGEADGLLFYVMPFFEGDTLRTRLEKEPQLPVDETIRLVDADGRRPRFRACARRDPSRPQAGEHPAAGGQPVIADFGIALAVAHAGGERITETGLSLGTPHYMSPEQAAGTDDVDARSDQFALGAVTYEMLVGEPPHTGPTLPAIIARVMTETPRSIRATRPAVPRESTPRFSARSPSRRPTGSPAAERLPMRWRPVRVQRRLGGRTSLTESPRLAGRSAVAPVSWADWSGSSCWWPSASCSVVRRDPATQQLCSRRHRRALARGTPLHVGRRRHGQRLLCRRHRR